MKRIVLLFRLKESVLLLFALATAVLVGGAGALLGACGRLRATDPLG